MNFTIFITQSTIKRQSFQLTAFGTLIGEGISAEDAAQSAGSITNELLSRIDSRVKCIVKD